MKVYFISGLAADSRVFKYIKLPKDYETVYLEWITPFKNESLKEYALRLAEPIDKTESFIIVGLSMGGMIAAEIAKEYKPVGCILLCSVPTHLQMPQYFKLAYLLKLYRFFPIAILKKASMLNRGFTPDSKADRELLKQVIKESDPVFIRWALQAILSWKNEIIPHPLWHIHGSKDSVLPMRYTKPTHKIMGGNHLMIMSRADELNNFFEEVLGSLRNN